MNLKIKHINWQKLFYFLLILTGMTLPFPDYSLVSKSLIALALVWLLDTNFKLKTSNLLINLKPALAVSILFLLLILGSFYTDNLTAVPNELKLTLPLFLLPLIVFSTSIPKGFFLTFYKFFSFSVVLNSLLALFQALTFKFFNWGDYLYYQDFSIFINKHTTYFALLLVLAFLYFLYQLSMLKKNKLLHLTSLLFLLLMIYIVSNRISLIALFVASVMWFFFQIKSKKKKLIFIAISLLALIAVVNTPNFRNRMAALHKETVSKNQIQLRVIHWKSIFNTIKHNNIWMGGGSEAKRDYLYDQYKKNNYKIAYEERYNAHNQYLEIALDYGLTGLILFLLSLIYIGWQFVKTRDFLALSILSIFLIFMLTESILERQTGIITFAVFSSLLLHQAVGKTVQLKQSK